MDLRYVTFCFENDHSTNLCVKDYLMQPPNELHLVISTKKLWDYAEGQSRDVVIATFSMVPKTHITSIQIISPNDELVMPTTSFVMQPTNIVFKPEIERLPTLRIEDYDATY